ncbi:hypothetical protein ACUN7V_21025 [Quadrisphaera oryzae]|uniref:hypothetical protein n=1 Tax=Quadrisphaera oryzae TaxID=2509661 RepID=UPI00404476CF
MSPQRLLPATAGALLIVFIALAGRSSTAVALALAVVVVTIVSVVLQRDPSRRAERVVVASLVLWVAVPVTRLPSSLPLKVVLAGSLALAVAALLGPGRLRLPSGNPLVLGLFGVLLAATLGSPDSGAGIRLAVSAAAALVPFCFAAQLDARGRATVAAAVVTLAVVEGVLAVVEPWLYSQPLWVPALVDADGVAVPFRNELLGTGFSRSQGTLGHPLPLGLLLLVGISLLVKGPLAVSSRVRLLLLIPLLGGLVTAGARASLALGLLVLVLWLGRRPGPLRLYAAALLVAVSVALALTTANDTVSSTAGSGSVTHRVAALAAVEALLSRQSLSPILLGNGFGAVGRLTAEGLLHNDGLTAVDNQYVSLLAQGGLLGLALLVGVLVMALTSGSRGLRPAVWCCAVTMMLFDVFTWPPAVALMMLTLGLSLTHEPVAVPSSPGQGRGSSSTAAPRMPMVL